MKRINLADINSIIERLNYYHYKGSHKIEALALPGGIRIFMTYDDMNDTKLIENLSKKEAFIYLLGIERGDNIAQW